MGKNGAACFAHTINVLRPILCSMFHSAAIIDRFEGFSPRLDTIKDRWNDLHGRVARKLPADARRFVDKSATPSSGNSTWSSQPMSAYTTRAVLKFFPTYSLESVLLK